MSTAPILVFQTEVGDTQETSVTTAAQALWSVTTTLLEELELAIPSLRLVVTRDVMTAADVEGVRLGLGKDRRVGSERLGGVVAGKTLSDEAGEHATVIISADVAGGDGDLALVWSWGTIAHELGHVVYGSARDRYVQRIENCWLPWDVAEVLAILAAEEYRVDRIGHSLINRVLNLNSDEQRPFDFRAFFDGQYLSALPAALDAVLAGITDVTRAYRWHERGLEDMWAHVVMVTERMLLLLAHAQTHEDVGTSVLDCVRDHPAAGLVRPVWDPLFAYLATSPVVPKAFDSPADRDKLKALGREPVLAFWSKFGLQPDPLDDGFYLQVGQPTV
jgi:hypothetical protein